MNKTLMLLCMVVIVCGCRSPIDLTEYRKSFAAPDIVLPEIASSSGQNSVAQNALIVEINRSGYLSIQNVPVSKQILTRLLETRTPACPILIWADSRAKDVDRTVLFDLLSSQGFKNVWTIWQTSNGTVRAVRKE